jgi:hypothetical protein
VIALAFGLAKAFLFDLLEALAEAAVRHWDKAMEFAGRKRRKRGKRRRRRN